MKAMTTAKVHTILVMFSLAGFLDETLTAPKCIDLHQSVRLYGEGVHAVRAHVA
jgi:hypothetical protein